MSRTRKPQPPDPDPELIDVVGEGADPDAPVIIGVPAGDTPEDELRHRLEPVAALLAMSRTRRDPDAGPVIDPDAEPVVDPDAEPPCQPEDPDAPPETVEDGQPAPAGTGDDQPDAGPLTEAGRALSKMLDLQVEVHVEGVASRADHDPLTLLEDSEKVLATRKDGEVLWVVTSAGRRLGIGPDGSFSLTTGPMFPTAPAEVPEAEPETPAEVTDA